MMSGVQLETCCASNKLLNNKFYYKLHLVGISTESNTWKLDTLISVIQLICAGKPRNMVRLPKEALNCSLLQTTQAVSDAHLAPSSTAIVGPLIGSRRADRDVNRTNHFQVGPAVALPTASAIYPSMDSSVSLPPDRQQICTKLHGAVCQKIVTLLATAVSGSDIACDAFELGVTNCRITVHITV
jgi:hypothetical protein